MTLRIRPVRQTDHAEILALAGIAGIGMSSLPQDAEVLQDKIGRAVKSFAGNPVHPKEENFLFVLEDIENKRLVGTTGIVAHVGLTRPFYSYKLSTITQASPELGIYSLQQVLHMVNDYTDATEIGSLFLHPDYRKDGVGRFLSRSRYLMMAEFPELFSDVVISEIRGVQNENGHSPFYDNLAHHFFQMEFKDADYIYATKGTQFIADLMPKYPIYVNLLSKEAKAVIGVPFAASKPAMQLLQTEGFHYEGYVDLFDAGPTMQADRPNIRTVRKSTRLEVKAIREIESERYMICNTRLQDFSMAMGKIEKDGEGVIISPEIVDSLNIKIGDHVRIVQ
jgi:arginine N-succinyltransferase